MVNITGTSNQDHNVYEAIVNTRSTNEGGVSSTRQRDTELAIDVDEIYQPQHLLVPHNNQHRAMLRILQKDVAKWDPELRNTIDHLTAYGVGDVYGLQQLIDAARFQRDARAFFGACALVSLGMGITSMGAKTLGPVGFAIAAGLATAVFWALHKPDAPQSDTPSSLKDIALRKMGFGLLRDLQMSLAGEPRQFRAADVIRPANMEARLKELRDIIENREHGVVGTSFAFVAEVIQRAGEVLLEIAQSGPRAYTTLDRASRKAELGQIIACLPELLAKATAAFQRRNAAALPADSTHAATWNDAANQLEWLTRGGDPKVLAMAGLASGARQARQAARKSTSQSERTEIVDKILHRVTSDQPLALTGAQLLSLVGPFFEYEAGRDTHVWLKGRQVKLALTPAQWIQLSHEMAKGPAGFADSAQLNFVVELFQAIPSRFKDSEIIESIKPWLDNWPDLKGKVTQRFVSNLEGLFKQPALERYFNQELFGHIEDAWHAGTLDQATHDRIKQVRLAGK